MSYKCQICGKSVPSGKKSIYITVKTRTKYYPHRAKANSGYQTKNGLTIQPLRKSNKRSDRIDDPGGKGWEIDSEILVCEKCKESHRFT
jgi:ribosomal protein L28